jgi:cytochrome P450
MDIADVKRDESPTVAGKPAQAFPLGPPDRLTVDPSLARLRAEQPVVWVTMPYGGAGWLVTRYADIKTVLADPRFSRAATAGWDVPRALPPIPPASSILAKDPPEHSRLRRLVAQSFTPRRIEMMRPRIRQIVDDLLDTMIAAGPVADLASALAWPLPITIICELLGVPFADRDQFGIWTGRVFSLTATPEQVKDAAEKLAGYIAGLVAEHRAAPSDDLLSSLIQATDDDGRLSEAELATFGSDLLFAGHETTANQTGNAVYTLLADRAYWDELVADPDLIPAAVEELSRFIPLSASGNSTRIATEDLELGGRHIRAGEAVVTVLSSANRDAEVFDRPDEIDFHRAAIPHIAYGHGVHHCLGAQLARAEMQIAIAILVRRLPSLRLAVPAEDVAWRTRVVRGVTERPVTWDAE